MSNDRQAEIVDIGSVCPYFKGSRKASVLILIDSLAWKQDQPAMKQVSIRFSILRSVVAAAAVALGLVVTTNPAFAADSAVLDEPNTPFTFGDYFAGEIEEYSAWEDAVSRAAIDTQAEVDLAEPVPVPEPPAYVLLTCLGTLILAMTLLRWHFDRSKPVPATARRNPQSDR